MSPSPGQPWPHPDPWAEQERRRSAHQQRRRRRRLVWILPIVLVGLVVARGLYALIDDEAAGEAQPATEPTPSTVVATTVAPVTLPPPSTLSPAAVVRLDEVWLLDRQDGTYDWGLIVTSTDSTDREGVAVTARLLGAGGAVIATLDDEIGVLPAGERAAVGGVVADLAGTPVRIEADVAVGRSVAEAEPGSLDVVAVDRRPAPEGGGEVLTGRLNSTFAEEVESVRVAVIWRDESGAVVAAAFRDVERVRPRVEARFEFSLVGLVVPDGLPADVIVVR
ncbi:MAG: hypothetical protein ACR2O6_12750 [Ilumatobacteraceae bacterium]